MTNIISQYRWVFIQGVLFVTAFTFGLWGYLLYENNTITDSLFYTIRLFVLELDLSDAQTINWQIEIARFTAVAVVVIVIVKAILLFIDEKVFQYWRINWKKNHMIVCGLSEISVPYLKSENDSNVVIIEPDSSNSHIQEFLDKGMEVLIREYDSETLIETLSIENSKHVFIAAGDDIYNINMATTFIEYGFKHADRFFKEKKQVSILIHVVDRELYKLFEQTIIPSLNEKHSTCKDICIQNIFDIRMVSYYQETAKELLRDYPVDNNSMDLIKSKDKISVVLVGIREISISIVEEIFKQAHYPEENKVDIWIISDDSTMTKEIIDRHFFDWHNDLHFELIFIESDRRRKSFYDLSIWKDKSLTNIYLANENETDNLKIAMNLDEYIYNTYDKKPNILYYLKEQKHFASHVDGNELNYSTFNSFGKINTVLCEDNLIDQRHEDIAKIIYQFYNELLDLETIDFNNKSIRDSVDKSWRDAKTSDREYSRAQAAHMDIKLRSLGVKRVRLENESHKTCELTQDSEEVFTKALEVAIGKTTFDSVKQNYMVLGKIIEENDVDEALLFVKQLFDCDEKKETLFDKLTLTEHRRLNMYHFINGWKTHRNNKKPMIHTCLKDLVDLPDEEKASIYYAWASILNIPKYCSAAGYKLEKIDV